MWREYSAESRLAPGSYQGHHLIPSEVICAPQFVRLFTGLSKVGFGADDFATNGIALPCTEEEAIRSRLPLHRGPHPRYTEIVRGRVASIDLQYRERGSNRIAALQRMRWLQRGLEKALATRVIGCLNKRDPFRIDTDFTTLDSNIAKIENLTGG
ncbi:MAG: AHH domain-containing protein [Sphingorhabdus sp.]